MEKRILRVLALVLGMFILFASPYSFAKEKEAKFSGKSVTLQLALRDLWTEQIFWVRNVALMTKLGETDGAKVAEDMAIKNAHALADSMIPYYGQASSEKLFNILEGHYAAIKDYMTATYGADAVGQKAAADKINANAQQIASFLNAANPDNWPKATLVGLFTTHGSYQMAQIDAINRKDYPSDAKTWVDMKKQVYTVADTLENGIVKQFPKKF